MEKGGSTRRHISFAPVSLDTITEENSVLNDDEQERSLMWFIRMVVMSSRKARERKQRDQSQQPAPNPLY